MTAASEPRALLSFSDVLALFESHKKLGKEFRVPCPAHPDNDPSLDVTERDGWTVFNCRSHGCSTDAICRALGIAKYQLGPPTDFVAQRPVSRTPGPTRGEWMPDGWKEIIEMYDYTNLDGDLKYQVVRGLKHDGDKDFRQRRPVGPGRWKWNMDGVDPLLFHLPQLVEGLGLGKHAYIVEGEKDVLTLEQLGLVATTNSGGAGKWRDEYGVHFKGANVVILPDNDDKGRAHATKVERALHGIAASVRIVELPHLPPKGDVTDWFAAGGTRDELESIVARSAQAEEVPSVFLSLATLLERPELLKPPECAVPRLSFKGRSSLLAGPDKAGKSTLLANAASEMTKRGTFLGEPIGATTARVAWVGLEEATGDAVRRFHDQGAIPENIQLLVLKGPSLLDDIRKELRERPADLIIVDSLTECARVVLGKVPDDSDTSGWSSLIRPLSDLSREFAPLSVIIAHHPRRSDGQFRGAMEIAAAVDCLLEMRRPKEGEHPNIRHITGRARWTVEDFDIRYTDGRYELAGGAQLSLDARVLIHIEQNRGIGLGELRRLAGGRGVAVDAALAELIQRGAVVDLMLKGAHSYHPAGAKPLALDLSA